MYESTKQIRVLLEICITDYCVKRFIRGLSDILKKRRKYDSVCEHSLLVFRYRHLLCYITAGFRILDYKFLLVMLQKIHNRSLLLFDNSINENST